MIEIFNNYYKKKHTNVKKSRISVLQFKTPDLLI